MSLVDTVNRPTVHSAVGDGRAATACPWVFEYVGITRLQFMGWRSYGKLASKFCSVKVCEFCLCARQTLGAIKPQQVTVPYRSLLLLAEAWRLYSGM